MMVTSGKKCAGLLVAVAEGSFIGTSGIEGGPQNGAWFSASRQHCTTEAGLP
ncbi:MAG: hypothetical protein ACRYG8_15750 [Janthinobacterium lividum]